MKNNHSFPSGLSEGYLKSDDSKKGFYQIPISGKYIYLCWYDGKLEMSFDEGARWTIVGDLNESIN